MNRPHGYRPILSLDLQTGSSWKKEPKANDQSVEQNYGRCPTDRPVRHHLLLLEVNECRCVHNKEMKTMAYAE